MNQLRPEGDTENQIVGMRPPPNAPELNRRRVGNLREGKRYTPFTSALMRTISTKSGLRLAPPTSAPSMSG